MIPIPLMALLVAQPQGGGSSSSSARTALLALLIKPRMLGLLMAIALSKQAAPIPLVLPAPNPKPDGSVIDSVVPKHGHSLSFFPTFLGLTKKQASSFARELDLEPTFFETEHNTPGKDTVKGQEPVAGASWPHDLKTVKLYVA